MKTMNISEEIQHLYLNRKSKTRAETSAKINDGALMIILVIYLNVSLLITSENKNRKNLINF